MGRADNNLGKTEECNLASGKDKQIKEDNNPKANRNDTTQIKDNMASLIQEMDTSLANN